MPIGIAADTLSYRLGTRMKVAATSLLHDIPARPNTAGLDQKDPASTAKMDYTRMIIKIWKMRDRFGAEDDGVEKLYYWNNREYVTVSPEKCHALLIKHPENGVLAFVSNLRPDARTVSVEFDLAKLALEGKPLKVFNALNDEPFAMTPGGKVSVPLGSEEWVYLWLRPAGAR